VFDCSQRIYLVSISGLRLSGNEWVVA
jgi:hypothetical protein